MPMFWAHRVTARPNPINVRFARSARRPWQRYTTTGFMGTSVTTADAVTALYSAAFATAAVLDANFKEQRRAKLDADIAAVEASIEASKQHATMRELQRSQSLDLEPKHLKLTSLRYVRYQSVEEQAQMAYPKAKKGLQPVLRNMRGKAQMTHLEAKAKGQLTDATKSEAKKSFNLVFIDRRERVGSQHMGAERSTSVLDSGSSAQQSIDAMNLAPINETSRPTKETLALWTKIYTLGRGRNLSAHRASRYESMAETSEATETKSQGSASNLFGFKKVKSKRLRPLAKRANGKTQTPSTRKSSIRILSIHKLSTEKSPARIRLTRTSLNRELSTRELLAQRLLTRKLLTQKLLTRKLLTRKLLTRKLLTRKLATRKLATRKHLTQRLLTRKLAARKLSARKLSTQEEGRLAAGAKLCSATNLIQETNDTFDHLPRIVKVQQTDNELKHSPPIIGTAQDVKEDYYHLPQISERKLQTNKESNHLPHITEKVQQANEGFNFSSLSTENMPKIVNTRGNLPQKMSNGNTRSEVIGLEAGEDMGSSLLRLYNTRLARAEKRVDVSDPIKGIKAVESAASEAPRLGQLPLIHSKPGVSNVLEHEQHEPYQPSIQLCPEPSLRHALTQATKDRVVSETRASRLASRFLLQFEARQKALQSLQFDSHVLWYLQFLNSEDAKQVLSKWLDPSFQYARKGSDASTNLRTLELIRPFLVENLGTTGLVDKLYHICQCLLTTLHDLDVKDYVELVRGFLRSGDVSLVQLSIEELLVSGLALDPVAMNLVTDLYSEANSGVSAPTSSHDTAWKRHLQHLQQILGEQQVDAKNSDCVHFDVNAPAFHYRKLKGNTLVYLYDSIAKTLGGSFAASHYAHFLDTPFPLHVATMETILAHNKDRERPWDSKAWISRMIKKANETTLPLIFFGSLNFAKDSQNFNLALWLIEGMISLAGQFNVSTLSLVLRCAWAFDLPEHNIPYLEIFRCDKDKAIVLRTLFARNLRSQGHSTCEITFNDLAGILMELYANNPPSKRRAFREVLYPKLSFEDLHTIFAKAAYYETPIRAANKEKPVDQQTSLECLALATADFLGNGYFAAVTWGGKFQMNMRYLAGLDP